MTTPSQQPEQDARMAEFEKRLAALIEDVAKFGAMNPDIPPLPYFTGSSEAAVDRRVMGLLSLHRAARALVPDDRTLQAMIHCAAHASDQTHGRVLEAYVQRVREWRKG